MAPHDTDYQIFDKSGDVLETGGFTYAYPQHLAPGQVGYFADETLIDGAKPDQIGKVEADAFFSEADSAEATTFEFDRIKVIREEFSDGYVVSGLITADQDTDSAAVAVLFFGSGGKFLGFTSTNL
ncbi:MAG TPA: hypothetical protein VFK38_07275, partial [Candidatus Limnocylindrales bacterium]|nr:hypothetical protein [Candidatus Limnocylindrales bacterium]